LDFSQLRERLEGQSVVVKRTKIEDSNVIFYNEEEKYKISVDGVLLDEEFDNLLDAEAAVKEFLKLVEAEEIKEIKAKAKLTPKELNKLSDNMKLNSIQKMILFDYVYKGVLNQRYSGKEAG
jgi:hypothetical protein